MEMPAVVIVLGMGVGMVPTFSLEKRPSPPHGELPRAACLVVHWELAWVGDVQGADSLFASAFACVGRTWQGGRGSGSRY